MTLFTYYFLLSIDLATYLRSTIGSDVNKISRSWLKYENRTTLTF